MELENFLNLLEKIFKLLNSDQTILCKFYFCDTVVIIFFALIFQIPSVITESTRWVDAVMTLKEN